MSELVRDLGRWRKIRDGLGEASLGFVPTMGALHAGHAALVRRSVAENDATVVSVFVNPTQFDDPDDLAAYPRSLDGDAALAGELGADWVLAPAGGALYPDGFTYRVSESEVSGLLCGRHRPGHFDGVLTVVLKLLNLVRPDVAYFGEKDYQQLELIRGMVDAFFLDVEVRAEPIVRDPDGLALSSRNARLSDADRARATAFPRLLATAAPIPEVERRLQEAGFDVDYVDERWGRRLGAVRLGDVRLIDNVEVTR